MKYQKIVLLIVCIFFFLLPFILWGNVYLAGGDDTKLYYIFPNKFISHYALNVASENTLAGAMTGYASVAYFAPLFYILSFAKLFNSISTQMLFYGMNLSLGFLFFYQFLGLWLKEKTNYDYFAKVMASIFYVCSIFLVNTLYTHQLLSFYLVSLVPVVLLLFIKSIRSNKIVFSLAAVLIFSLFSTTFNVLPWIAGFLLSSVPIMIYELVKNPRAFVKQLFLSLIAFILLNNFWLFHFLNAALTSSGLAGQMKYYTNSSFVADNLRIVMGVSRIFSPIAIPFLSLDSQALMHLSINNFISLLPFVIVICAGIGSYFHKELGKIYALSLLGFLLSWFLFSPNFGEWGPRIFLSLSIHIPFFTMFRNMYDKFSLSLAFYYAFVFCVSLQVLFHIVTNVRSKVIFLVIMCIAMVFILTNSYQAITTRVNAKTEFSGTFNDDYTNLTTYLFSLHNASHVLWLPLNDPTYANIEDKYHPGHFYSGLSPLQEFTGMPDYAGRFSFIREGDLFFGDKLFLQLKNKQFEEFGKVLQADNAKYVVIDHQKLPEDIQEFMYGGKEKPLLAMQNKEFIKTIIGNKIKDFGKRYTLYEINQKFDNDKIYLSTSSALFAQSSQKVTYKKNNDSEYEITVSHIDKNDTLFFLEPFDQRWKLNIKQNITNQPLTTEHIVVEDYANGWVFKNESINTTFLLNFDTVKYGNLIYIVSILTGIGIFVYCMWSLIVTFSHYEKK